VRTNFSLYLFFPERVLSKAWRKEKRTKKKKPQMRLFLLSMGYVKDGFAFLTDGFEPLK